MNDKPIDKVFSCKNQCKKLLRALDEDEGWIIDCLGGDLRSLYLEQVYLEKELTKRIEKELSNIDNV